MKNPIRLVLLFPILFLALMASAEAASPCTEAMIRAMKEEGLSAAQIRSICTRAESNAKKKAPVFTPEKIGQDLVGMSVGPEAGVIVETYPARHPGASPRSRPSSRGSRSYDALVSVPLGITFDETNIQEIRVLDTRAAGSKAQVVAYVETVSSYAGKLRLYYEQIAGDWNLMQIENLNFRMQ